ncbi:hypothetical protein ASPACDRAFT_1875621 [Aspergillus aculeatus ATCC 16872]|uniref:Zn(2)-C6 fungal-type domain-containing protein n=1 Tax=Aspergillus aculeatus (strain ATCC 16872 / CBS 172.66 / WB 5094) TaxID=690307 RepID=A0A1L9WIP3_ASPA1|nr:uncharacterized protein ASPACDRAFT_1875621 [Aspergillus aculeatus ATCC 16872]OJJ96051.1 hypothetical protein ASPACDRAFT_1875621 [Aspergillus aculeatus ATCC 16872]
MNVFPQTTLASRRRRIAKACDFCREHRVRCEAATPCPPCVANNIVCRRSRPVNPPRKVSQRCRRNCIQPPGRGVLKQSADRSSVERTPVNDAQPVESVPPPSPSASANLAWTSHKIDSTLGFIARINAFCGGESQLSPSATAPGSNPSLGHISPFPSTVLPEPQGPDCDLSPSQINHLMRFFWSRLRPLMPIVEWKDLTSSSRHPPLQDAVTAVALHYVYHSKLHTRLVGFNWPQFERRSSTVGMPYFQRSLPAVTQLTTFAAPSLPVIQCYCYLTTYLLDAGHHQAAYNMVGLALRIAQSMNYMDARHRGQPVCQLFRRLWWTLVCLDFRCSRHVGKPVTVLIENLIWLMPNREPQDVHLSNGLLYHTESIRLTAAALAVSEAMGHRSVLDGAVDPAHLERRAKCLSDSLYHLQDWCDAVSRTQVFPDLFFEVPDVPPDDTQDAPELEGQSRDQSSMVTLLSTLLLLQYHNAIISLHRVFVQFPSYPFVPKSHPKADAHAATALNHALTMIRTTHQRMGLYEVLHGLSEIYQYQWNAVLTIIGFMLAYPYCHRCARARAHLDLALEIFDLAGSENITAARAAALTRQLCTKTDTLVQVLGPGHPTPAPTAESEPLHDVLSDPSAWPVMRTERTPLPEVDDEAHWAWADLINWDAWSSYCEGVSEAFMDAVELTPPQT